MLHIPCFFRVLYRIRCWENGRILGGIGAVLFFCFLANLFKQPADISIIDTINRICQEVNSTNRKEFL